MEQDTERRCHTGQNESLTEQWTDKRRALCRVEADGSWFDFDLSISSSRRFASRRAG